MSLETTLESNGCLYLKAELGAEPVKMGLNGDPDRLVLCGEGQHFWVEFKRPGEQLRPAQVARIAQLRATGDTVYVVASNDGMAVAVEDWRLRSHLHSRCTGQLVHSEFTYCPVHDP